MIADMDIEPIGSDKLRVSLSSADLDHYDLDYGSISSESPGTRRMLRDILSEAGETNGFSSRDCRLLIEVLPGKENGCVLYLTRRPKPAGRPARAARAPRKANGRYILSCLNIDDTIEAILRFRRYPDIALVNSSLYNFGGKYHLTFTPVGLGLDRTRLSALLADLSEYGDTSQTTPAREAVLAEHGSTIRGSRAVESFIRFFH